MLMDRHQFIEKYFATYLTESRVRNPFIAETQHSMIPPTSQELEELVIYFSEAGIYFIIGNTLAAIKHLKVTREDIQARVYRPISKVVLFTSQKLPPPPTKWQEIKNESEHTLWKSPEEGYVEFRHIENLSAIEQDPESIDAQCPVVEFTTLFKMKLKSTYERDLLDLLSLARVLGIPQELDFQKLSETQKKALNFINLWLKNRSNNGGE